MVTGDTAFAFEETLSKLSQLSFNKKGVSNTSVQSSLI